jgi:hypothetical protein
VARDRDQKNVTDDWYDFLVALLDSGARFLVVGAHALAVHGVPRATQDLDVWIDMSADNAERVWDALRRFGAPAEALGVTREDLVNPGVVIQFGLPPNRIDVMTAISGVRFEDAWPSRVEKRVRDRAVPFLGREAFVANKRASGRFKDLGDVEALGEDVRAPE